MQLVGRFSHQAHQLAIPREVVGCGCRIARKIDQRPGWASAGWPQRRFPRGVWWSVPQRRLRRRPYLRRSDRWSWEAKVLLVDWWEGMCRLPPRLQDGWRPQRMPCSYGHMLHQNCLTKWLAMSRLCPLRRQQDVLETSIGPKLVTAGRGVPLLISLVYTPSIPQ